MPALHDFFANKTVVITGAASAIGKALATLFASLGCKVAICDIDAAALSNVAAALKSAHPNMILFSSVFDVSSKAGWEAHLTNVTSHCEHIDVVINNAGIEGSAQPVWASDDELLKRVMDVNFYGMVYGSKTALPYLTTRPWAALVNVSSIAGLVALPNAADYCASKFAIRGYTESLRAELMLVHPQVQVHLVHPGGINTNITRLERTQKVKARFLTTPPQALALNIANSIMHNKARIVFGNQATKTHIASRILPLKWLTKLIAKEINELGMEGEYQVDHEGFKVKKEANAVNDLCAVTTPPK